MPVIEKRPRLTPRAKPRARPRSADAISVRGARAHNLQGVDVDFAKRRFTVVTGVSGSGKSSLVHDVVAAEATRRLLECLSVYERESVREGPEAPVDAITGLGPTMSLDATSTIADTRQAARSTVARSSDLDRLIAIVMTRAGVRTCLACGSNDVRRTSPAPEASWTCAACATAAVAIEPRHLMGSPAAICPECLGLGVTRRFVPERYVLRPDRAICKGCFPNGLVGYFCDPKSSAHGALHALAERYQFDPRTTPWSEMSEKAQHAFLIGDPEPFPVQPDPDGRVRIAWGFGGDDGVWYWRGMNLWMSGPGDAPSDYWDIILCDECEGRRLRPPYLAIRLDGRDRTDLFSSSLVDVEAVLASMDEPDDAFAAEARTVALRRLRFLGAVGLGYLNLDRRTLTLSAGEAQRIKLASVLGGGLVGMTVLLDEPSRGLHPSEVSALARTLIELRDAGNTVIAVEHDPTFIRAADAVIEIGPGPGRAGGRVVDVDSEASVTRALLEGRISIARRDHHREPKGWMQITGARENNLRGLDVRIPLGVQVGVCGVSGSGKSSLVVDTIARSLAKPKVTLAGAETNVPPGAHDEISGAPGRTVVADQSRADITSPGMFLGLVDAIRKEFAASEVAGEHGITVKDLCYGCDACGGKGTWHEGMWFLPSVAQSCDACSGTGYRHEVAGLVERGRTLAGIEALTIGELVDDWGDVDAVRRLGGAALAVGLGYLIVRQPGWSLSGGEAQRLKLAKALARPGKGSVLYVLDEPTVGLQITDVAVLARALDAIVDADNTVLVVEHDPVLLATCDWLIELGPGAGPEGGEIIFEGPPEALAKGDTPTAPYLLEALA